MDIEDLKRLLKPYNPWHSEPHGDWRRALPAFERPILRDLWRDLGKIPQIISITGPRRVGKTTPLHQLVCHLIDEKKVKPERILYFSFDDPAVVSSPEMQEQVFDHMVEAVGGDVRKAEQRFFLLDEIQYLPRWELFLKKYYDLKYPIKSLVSGSASSPIFRKTQESLLGRIKDYHLLPFSFLEFCLYRFQKKPAFTEILTRYKDIRDQLLNNNGESVCQRIKEFHKDIQRFRNTLNKAVLDFCREGGFPETWLFRDVILKQEYLWENQVRKVLYEDLALATEYRKPENVLRFFVYLLAHPGIEINIQKIAVEAGVNRKVVSDNFPLLEMTDLVMRMHKFRKDPIRPRQGNIKCYLRDLALRNAVMKTWDDFATDAGLLGLCIENIVANHLVSWKEILEVAYYRQRQVEVDFIVTHAASKYLPIEVKYRKKELQKKGLQHFMKKFKIPIGVILTRELDIGFEEGILLIPVRYFLLVL